VFRTVLAGVLALVLAASASAAPALGTLVIKVEKVSPRGGDIRVALYDAATYSDDTGNKDVGGAVVAAKPGETVVTLTGIKPGIYAVKLFQDFNRNGKFDMTWYGLPAEKYGFSNDALPTLSEPSFDATKFEVRAGENTITVTLR
jgi:uncharacterized protein (DUF2141 family)